MALQARLKACGAGTARLQRGHQGLVQGQSTHGSGQDESRPETQGPWALYQETSLQEHGRVSCGLGLHGLPLYAPEPPGLLADSTHRHHTGRGHSTPPAAAPGLTPTGHQEALLHVAWQCPGTGERGRENTIN